MRVVTPAGRPAADWQPTIELAPERDVRDLAPDGGTLLVLAAHPDDETIGAGRLISAWTRAVGPVTVASMSSGEACVEHVGVHVPDLADRRRAEFRKATAELGVRQALCWSLPDSEVGHYLPYVSDGIAALIEDAVLVAAPWRHDPHPDHAALGAAAAQASAAAGIRLLEYPIWSSFWQCPELPARNGFRLVRITTTEQDSANRDRALGNYRTQLLPLRPDLTPVVPAAMLEHHRRQFIFEPTDRTLTGSEAFRTTERSTR